jgi:hypothetical protein
MEVSVIDEGGLVGSVSMSVLVTDANEPPLMMNSTYVFEVPENQETRTNVGSDPCSATDLDEDQDLSYAVRVVSDNMLTTYNLTHSSDFSEELLIPFGIVECSGQLLLLRTLDYESQKVWHLEVTATDDGLPPKTDVARVTIHVQDMNEDPEFARGVTLFTVDEGVTIGTVVGTVIASDPEHDQLVYNMDDDVPFLLDSITGVLSVSSSLDFETMSTYVMTVMVQDVDKNPTGSDEMLLTVIIGDMQESPSWSPSTKTSNMAMYVSEHADLGVVIGSEFCRGSRFQ